MAVRVSPNTHIYDTPNPPFSQSPLSRNGNAMLDRAAAADFRQCPNNVDLPRFVSKALALTRRTSSWLIVL